MSMVIVCKDCGTRMDLLNQCPKCGGYEKEFTSYIQISAPSSRLLAEFSYDFCSETDISLIQDIASALVWGYISGTKDGDSIFRPFFWYDPDCGSWTVQVKVYAKP